MNPSIVELKIPELGTSLSFDSRFLMFDPGIVLVKGPNGIGKTSFFKSLHRQSGQFFAHSVGWLGQNKLTSFLPYKVRQMIDILLDQEGIKSWAEMEEAKYFWDIEKLLHKNISDLSGGEEQRLKFFLLEMQKFEIALMDEPFAALDSVFLAKAIERTKQLAQKNLLYVIDHHYFNHEKKRALWRFEKNPEGLWLLEALND